MTRIKSTRMHEYHSIAKRLPSCSGRKEDHAVKAAILPPTLTADVSSIIQLSEQMA